MSDKIIEIFAEVCRVGFAFAVGDWWAGVGCIAVAGLDGANCE